MGFYEEFIEKYDKLISWENRSVSKLLSKAGFKDIRYYGNYKFRKFDIGNDDFLIIVCKK